MPTVASIDKFGNIEITFSSNLNPPTLEQFHTNLDLRRLQSVDVEFDESFSAELTEASGLDQLIKLTNSVEMSLVPGSNMDLDKREFSWSIVHLEGKEMVIELDFDNPEYISSGDDNTDVLVISFYNTEYFLQPDDLDKKPIGDGYQLSINLPV